MDAPAFEAFGVSLSSPSPAPQPDAALIEAALDHLARKDPALAEARRWVPVPAWRVREGSFPGLMRIMIGQQLSVRAAASIWGRLDATLNPVSAEGLMDLSDQELRGLGFSLAKIRHARALASAHLSGALDFEGLRERPHAEAVAILTAYPGVGPWTAEVYLLFCEGRIDAFPAGDVALQEALRRAEGADLRPDADALLRRAEDWRPFRGVAAHLLWAFYSAVRRPQID